VLLRSMERTLGAGDDLSAPFGCFSIEDIAIEDCSTHEFTDEHAILLYPMRLILYCRAAYRRWSSERLRARSGIDNDEDARG
jgi:hypothetical protein